MNIRYIVCFLILILLTACSRKAEKITKLDQLKDKRICVLTGSAGDIAARTSFPGAQILDMSVAADAALAVKSGKADAFVYDNNVLLNIAEKNPDLIILEEPVSQLEIAAGIKKENIVLLTEINSAINELKRSGIIDDLKKKWINKDKSISRSAINIPRNNIKGTLRMGTCANIEPFSFIKDGQPGGFDIELSKLIGNLIGNNIEIIDMAFEGLIPALQSGKIDFALSNFNITEERRKSINFSTPYLSNNISALVRK